jgi:glycosyltransferase involved in cell wall biosynthesis
MKIAYVTEYDVLNRAAWSKTQPGLCEAGYFLSKHLIDEKTTLDYIGPLQKKPSIVTKAKWNLYRHLFKKDYYRWAEPLIVKNYAKQVKKKLNAANSDVVLCPENVIPIAYLNCKQPIVLWTDSTLSSLINFYPYMSNLCQETIKNIYEMEAAALNRCHLAIYASDWAAESAIHTYGVDVSKVKVIPWGANLECSRTEEEIHRLIKAKTASPCRLLFFGVDWLRKGGNVALEVAKRLNQSGLETELIVVGCRPISTTPLPSFVKSLGYINKFTQAGSEQINQLLATSHFLILPSQAECYGHVFCEANSFGVPCLATDVGGIPTVIKPDLNGKTFSSRADPAEYCTYITHLMMNYSAYEQLALSSFQQYQSRLNWAIASQQFKQLLTNFC